MKFRLKAKTQKAIRGSISVLLVIILLPMMTFSAVIVDTSRLNMAKEMMSSAGDLTMNTALANYDTILKDVYGLFAMSQEKTEAQLAADLKNYFEETISGYGVVSKAEAGDYVESLMGNFNVLLSDTGEYQNTQLNDLLKLENLTLEADRIDSSALANSSVLRNQIVEYMKFRAPLEFGMSFIDALKSFEVADEQMKVVDAQVKAQEGTEDVSTACSKLIKLIREYDTLVKDINSGSKAVKGLQNSTDGIVIPIKDYDTQIQKYLTNWGENYTHINKLMMVFLAKAPTVNEVYLVKQNVGAGVYFIKTDGSDVVYENSGINVTVTTKSNRSEAKTQVLNQITAMESLTSKANIYDGKNFINKDHINSEKTAFVNEDSAIENYIAYEKFLKDLHPDIKYSDVRNMLEQIYILGKYFDNYEGKIKSEINTANTNLQAAKNTLAQINNTINGINSRLSGYVTAISDACSEFVGEEQEYKFLERASAHKTTATVLLERTLPDISGNYSAYYNTYFASASSSNYSKYLQLYKDVANTLKNNGSSAEQAVAKAALAYLDSGSSKTLEKYFESEVSVINRGLTIELRDFFICLYNNNETTEDFRNGISEYNTAVQKKSAAQTDVNNKQRIYDDLVSDYNSTKTSYTGCLAKFKNFVKAYQDDAYYYGNYITTATNIINRETGAVQKQFNDICSNINELTNKLSAIKTQAGTVWTKIDEYEKKLKAWSDANDTYAQNNSTDSFSKQTASDIATAESNYNKKSLETLQNFVSNEQKTGIYDRFSDFYTYLQGDVYFKYGGKRLHEIKNSTDAKDAAKSNIASISEEVITTAIATTNLGYLYKTGPEEEFRPYTMEMARSEETDAADKVGQLCFLEPVVMQIQFLKYLNSSYPETAPTVEEGETDPKVDYEKTEEDLKSPDKSIDAMGKDDGTGGGTSAGGKTVDRYGYSYKSTTLSDTDKSTRPSKDKVTSSEPDNSAFALSENEKASDNVGKQSGALSTILTGLGSAVTAGLENAYILTYLFENFSYNTMIQDAVMEGEVDKLGGKDAPMANLTNAKALLSGETLGKYKDNLKTLSGITKRADNNYLYGAEIEYILFGNTTPSKNVTSAKASIYAIRFCFNCIYAFTNTEIRNTTMAAGLAVQAATLGIVPYQVVQIVLQLALAAAESAVDMDMMMSGLDVAIVKTKETWMLSVTTAVKTVGSVMADTAANYAGKAINAVAGGLQKVVDASADKISGAIDDLKKDLQTSAEKAVTDTIDQMFSAVLNKVEDVLNRMQFVELKSRQEIINWVDTELTAAQTAINSELDSRFGSSDVGKKVLKIFKEQGYVANVINDVKTKVAAAIPDNTPATQAVETVLAELINIKMSMIDVVTGNINAMLSQVQTIAKDAVSEATTELSGLIGEKGEELSEEAAERIKEEANRITNDFVDKTLSKIDTTAGGGSGGNSIASVIKFGYKEYLMLFTYIAICAGGTAENNKILLRTADLIQFNIAHAAAGASFKHAKGTAFQMKNACTYISVKATAELDMFFMNLDLFASVVEDESEVTTESDRTGTLIKYKGILGY